MKNNRRLGLAAETKTYQTQNASRFTSSQKKREVQRHVLIDPAVGDRHPGVSCELCLPSTTQENIYWYTDPWAYVLQHHFAFLQR